MKCDNTRFIPILFLTSHWALFKKEQKMILVFFCLHIK
nr:MAG TPA: hypothetical protein [Caudoviricetes sp.]